MSEETCAFCLGGTTEIPPFGTVKDAEDLIAPCSTCSLVAHRKCLLDWFNSIPASRLTRTHDVDVDFDELQRPGDAAANATEDPDQDTDNEPNIINVTFQSPWMSAAGLFVRDPDYDVHAGLSDSRSVLMLTACPQCKCKITFCMKRLAFLGFNTLVRASVSDLVQYAGVFLGLSGAATGIVSMGYVGLARCGINMMDAVVPSSILFPLLSRKKSPAINAGSLIFSGPERIDRALSIADQLKFQHIPLLPVMLYRMRNLLILTCFFNTSARAALTNWGGELLVCNYLSSLGNHVLVKQVFLNLKVYLALVLKSPLSLKSYHLGKLFRNINWWDPNVMVGSLIPVRWLYDILFRLTFNRLHFDLTATIRPRDIANKLSESELARLEDLDNQVGRLHIGLRHKVKQAKKNNNGPKALQLVAGKLTLIRLLLQDDILLRFAKTKLLLFYHKMSACLKNDFSSSFLYNLAIVTGVTSVLWPFLASDLGKVIYKLILLRMLAFEGVDDDKVIFLANLIGMFGVALIKDGYNLFMSSRKARQLSQMAIVYTTPHTPATSSTSNFPGSYEGNE